MSSARSNRATPSSPNGKRDFPALFFSTTFPSEYARLSYSGKETIPKTDRSAYASRNHRSLPSFNLSPKRQDALGELIPVSVSVGSLPFDLAVCGKLGRNSYINLDTPSDAETNVELLAAGIPVARGQAVVIEEAMGMRVTKILKPFPQVTAPRMTGNIGDMETKRIAKTYNFRMPDRFSRNQIRSLTAIHELCARNLSARFAEVGSDMKDLKCAFIDQCTYREALDLLVQHGLVPAFTAEHGGQRPLYETDSESHFMTLYEPVPCARPVSAEIREYLEKMNSESGIMRRRPLFVSFAANASFADSFSVPADQKQFLSCVSGGWKNHTNFGLSPAESSDEDITIGDNEMVIMIELARGESKPMIGFIYPFITIESYLSILGG